MYKKINSMSNENIMEYIKDKSMVNFKYGRLTIKEEKRSEICFSKSHKTKQKCKNFKVLIKCDCGNEFNTSILNFFKSGKNVCGKCPDLPNGIRKSEHYTRAEKILERCNNPRHKHYKNYGGRGIKCLLGSTPGEVVLKLMEVPGYKPGLQIDRIDNDGHYTIYHQKYGYDVWYDSDNTPCKGNLRWVTPFFNNMHRSITINENTLSKKWRVMKVLRNYVKNNKMDLKSYLLLKKSFKDPNVYNGKSKNYFILIEKTKDYTSVPFYDSTVSVMTYDLYKYYFSSTTIPERK